MEMMVVLLIVSIIMAATAPLVAKKMKSDRATGGSPWIYTSNDGSIGYNLRGNGISVLIGASKYNPKDGPKTPRLVLAGDNDSPAFVFAKKNGDYAGQINMTDDQVTMNGLVNGSGAVGANSVAIGMGQTHNAQEGTVAIGQGAGVKQAGSIAIGNGATVNDDTSTTDDKGSSIVIGNGATSKTSSAIVIGHGANTDGATSSNRTSNGKTTKYVNKLNIAIGNAATTRMRSAIAIGTNSKAYGIDSIAVGASATANKSDSSEKNNGKDNGIAIGNGAIANGNCSVAIGLNATATGTNSVAIGQGASTSTDNRIKLGTSDYTVHIPGNLTVDGNLIVRNHVALGTSANASVNMRFNNGDHNNDRWYGEIGCDDDSEVYHHKWNETRGDAVTLWSDKRLKNIGEKYVSGLESIKKLDIYNFTFKNDKTKAPHVGVIAQDLQKVFPSSVATDTTGYLRIRWDEMFYAVINAVKELDTKLTELSKNVQSYFDRTAKLEATIEAQQKIIDDLKNQNILFEKRLTELEKSK